MSRSADLADAAAAGPRLELTVLGHTSASVGGEVADLPAKALALLCFLAVERRPVDRRRLLELLWPERGGSDEGASLRMALSQLRRALGGLVDIGRASAALADGPAPWVDALELEEAVLARPTAVGAGAASAVKGRPVAEEERLGRAASLYRGPFLADLELADAPEFEAWREAHAQRFAAAARECLLRLLACREEAGDLAAALAAATRLVEIEPLDESAVRRLMSLHARRGEHLLALERRREFAAALEAELDLEPSEETQRLAARIEAARGRPPPPLPEPVGPLVGRDGEIEEVARLLVGGESRLVTLTGLGGVGKTRLAVEVAGRLRAAFLEGAWFVELASATTLDEAVSAVLEALEPGARRPPDPRERLRELLAPCEALLVLDNVEQLGRAASELVADLLGSAPALRVLATSRSRLRLRREWVLGVPGLSLASEADAGPSDAERLFLVAAARTGVRLGAGERPLVARVCALLAGHPLAIELAAGSLWRQSPADLLAALEGGELAGLATEEADVAERSASVTAVMGSAWSLLTPRAAAALEALTVFASAFDREAALAVAGADHALLAELASASLLAPVRGAFAFHPLMRAYGRERLARHPDREREARARHAAHFLERVKEALRRYWSPDKAEHVRALKGAQEELRAALAWAVAEDAPLALAYVRRLWQFWLHWGDLIEGRRWLEAALAVAPEPDALDAEGRHDLAEALNGAASLAFRRGDLAGAEALYRRSLALARALEDHKSVGNVLNNLANVLRVGGDGAAAEAAYQEALELRRRIGDSVGEASTLANLGLLAERTGDLARARERYERSLAVRRAVGDLSGEANSLCNIGYAAAKLGDLDAAGRALRQALAIYARLGQRDGMFDCLLGIAKVEVGSGRPLAAARLWGAAEALRLEMGRELDGEEARDLRADVELARREAAPEEVDAAWREGRELPLSAALALCGVEEAAAD